DPEAEGDDLVRIRLLGDRIGLGQLGCAPATESGHREVEPVPEEVNRARLAAVPAGELLEHAVAPVEDAPEAGYRVTVVRGMLGVVGKRGRDRHAERRLADLDVDPESAQYRVQRLVERRDGEPVGEWERVDVPVARLHDEPV